MIDIFLSMAFSNNEKQMTDTAYCIRNSLMIATSMPTYWTKL